MSDSVRSACSAFQAHAWKKDVCANCMRSKFIHNTKVKSPVSPKSLENSIAAAASKKCSTVKKTGLKSNDPDSVTSPTRKTYNYGGYRTNMKRDNDSTDSQLSVKSNSSDKSSSSKSSSKTNLSSTRSKNKKANSKDTTVSNINSKQKTGNSKDNISTSSNVNRNFKKEDSKESILSDKNSPNGNSCEMKNVEQALKTLTSGPSSSPLCTRKATGSRTTMNYATASSLINDNSADTSPTDSSMALSVNKGDDKNISGNNIDKNSATTTNSSWLHSSNATSSVKGRVNIPLDKNAGKLSFTVNPENKIVDKTAVVQNLSVSSATSGNSNIIKSSRDYRKNDVKTDSKNTSSKTVEKKKVLIDKGKYSTEKIIFDKSTVITTTTTTTNTNKETVPTKIRTSRIDTSAKAGNPISTSKVDEVKLLVNSKSEQNAVQSSSANSRKSVGSVSASKYGQQSVNKENVSSNKTRSSKMISEKKDKSSSFNVKTQERQSSISPRNVSGNQAGDGEGGKVVRKRSKSSRPSVPPPGVPPVKAMIESYTSDMSESPSTESQLGQLGVEGMDTSTTSTIGPQKDASFSDLYNDILNTLSETKNITPDLVNKLKADGPPGSDKTADSKHNRNSHYYHKYDRSSVSKNPGELTLSSAILGDGNSSIIIETMNTSFHAGSGEGEVEEVTAQTLTMPYNIVDVSTIVPRGKSPRLPSTPAPESRNSTLNRSTLNKKKGLNNAQKSSTGSNSPLIMDKNSGRVIINKGNVGLCNQRDDVGLDDNVCIDSEELSEDSFQGLPTRYWHTYEPIDNNASLQEQSANKPVVQNIKTKTKDKETIAKGKVKNNKQESAGSFVRCSATRATAPIRSKKSGSIISKSSNNSTNSNQSSEENSLSHLDLDAGSKKSANKNTKNANISKSAEDLLDDMTDSLGHPKKRKNSIKKKKVPTATLR